MFNQIVSASLRHRVFVLAGAVLLTLSLFAFWLGFQTTRERRPWLWICYAAMGIATLAKGPVGFLVPLIVIALYLSLTKQWRLFWQEGRPLAGTALTILIALPWYAGMWWLHGSEYADSAQANTVGRFLKPMEGHSFGFLFYVPVLLLGFFPWSGWLLFAWPQTFKSWRATGTPDATGDTIYNGALDNGAGVTQVLAIARAYAALPAAPRRSVLILFVAAEEQGLLGSEYYAKHPSIAPGRIAANINYDGGNIFGRSLEVASIGLGKSSLDGIVKTLAAEQGRTVVGDQFPDRGSFYRSDQFNFAKIGVPAIYMGAGVKFRDHADDWGKERVEAYVQKNYHQPSDEITAEWTFDGMIEDARLGFFAGLLVANADQMPTWTPGDEFEAARKAALAAVGK